MALLSAWILPSAAIEPEQSQIQMKCSGRVANSPPGLLGTLGLPPKRRLFHARQWARLLRLTFAVITHITGLHD